MILKSGLIFSEHWRVIGPKEQSDEEYFEAARKTTWYKLFESEAFRQVQNKFESSSKIEAQEEIGEMNCHEGLIEQLG